MIPPRNAHMNDRVRAAQTESEMLDAIRRGVFDYFLQETNDANGLVRDKTCPGWPASIAAVALGLTGTEDVHKLYTESFKGRDHLSGIQEEAQAIIRRVLRAGGRN